MALDITNRYMASEESNELISKIGEKINNNKILLMIIAGLGGGIIYTIYKKKKR